MNKLIVDGDELMGRRLEGYLSTHPGGLADIEEQTEELVKLVLDHDVSGLRFVKEQTDEICRYAMDIDPSAVWYIRDLTPELAEYGCRLKPELRTELQRQMRKAAVA